MCVYVDDDDETDEEGTCWKGFRRRMDHRRRSWVSIWMPCPALLVPFGYWLLLLTYLSGCIASV